MAKRTASERFWAKVELGPVPAWRPTLGSCWDWTGAAVKDHGRFWDGERMVMAYRWLWEQTRGPIAAGLQLDHLCRRPRCVNPEHLDPVTSRENTLRSPILVNRVKRECPGGHPYSPENTYENPTRPNRVCRVCARAMRRRWNVANAGAPVACPECGKGIRADNLKRHRRNLHAVATLEASEAGRG